MNPASPPPTSWLSLFWRSLTLPRDRDSPRLDFKLLKQFCQLTALYWGNRRAWRSHIALLMFLAYALAEPMAGAFVAKEAGDMLANLSSGQEIGFYSSMAWMLGVQFSYSVLFLAMEIPYSVVSIFWQRWLTRHFLDDYLRARNYYLIERDGTIDNPDERISNDITAFMQFPAQVLFDAVKAVAKLSVFGAVMWSQYHNLVLYCALWAISGTVVSVLVNRPLLNIGFVAKKLEGDFRYGLVHVRTHAESIALYAGEASEKRELYLRNDAIVANSLRNLFWIMIGRVWTAVYIGLNQLLPLMLVAPLMFAGQFGLSTYTQLMAAWTNMDSAFSFFGVQIWKFATNGALVGRLWGLKQECQRPQATRDSGNDIVLRPRPRGLEVEKLNLWTPDGARHLIADLSLLIEPGQSLLVEGVTGAGKSSLVRGLAGLWNRGTGEISRPAEVMFLSQKPYSSLGSLAEQVCYPLDPRAFSYEQLTEALAAVRLIYLEQRFGLDSERDWEQVLSPGEQQRLAFARLFLRRPQFVILDEATSALDLPGEERVYRHLQSLGCTYISVGHRPSLHDYHGQVLRLLGDGRWVLEKP